MLLGLKAKLMTAGAAVLALLAFIVRMQVLKAAKERAEQEADVLRARVHQQKTIKKIEQEEEQKLHSRRVELLKELEEEEFKGVDNLSNPNDF